MYAGCSKKVEQNFGIEIIDTFLSNRALIYFIIRELEGKHDFLKIWYFELLNA